MLALFCKPCRIIKNRKMNRKYKFITSRKHGLQICVNGVIIALFLVSFILFLIQSTNLENTINDAKLIRTACAVGIGLAIILTIISKIVRLSIYFEHNSMYIILFVGLFFFTSVLFGCINYLFADNKKVCETYTIIRKHSYGTRSKVYAIYVEFDDNTEREFSVGKKRYKNFNEGETVEICIAKGLFGFDFATDFNKTNK